MPRIPTPKNSLVAKLVLAFILAAVPPMLLSGKIVGSLVNQAVNVNMEHWLKEGTAYIFSVIDDVRLQIAALQTLEQEHFIQDKVRFEPGELESILNLGVDFLVLTDARGEVLFSAPAPYTTDAEPVYPGSSCYFATSPEGGQKVLAIVERRKLVAADGTTRELTMGTLFSLHFSDSGLDPLELRIFLPQGAEETNGAKGAGEAKEAERAERAEGAGEAEGAGRAEGAKKTNGAERAKAAERAGEAERAKGEEGAKGAERLSFREAYSTRPETKFVLPQAAVDAISSGAEEYFLPDPDWADASRNVHYLMTAIRDGQGRTLALIAVSALMRPFGGWFANANASTLFWLFLLLGAVLSGGFGFLLARGLVRPVRQLNEGVRRIADGHLEHRVPAGGSDEVAELAASFNVMAAQLERARHESVESNRRERVRMLGEIAIGFAHEIRNPLVVIKTSAELVRNTLPEEKREARLMGFVVEEVGRINRLLTEFLSFARPVPMTMESFPLRPLVESLLEMSAPELARRGIIWSIRDETGLSGKKTNPPSTKPENSRIIGERDKIRQVLLNLILNAMDAMPDGGRLDIRLYDAEDGALLCLDLRDTGKGIPEDLAPTIHLPFKSTKKNSLGLGLPVAYAIIEAHGGRIGFTTQAGQGTTFTVGLKR